MVRVIKELETKTKDRMAASEHQQDAMQTKLDQILLALEHLGDAKGARKSDRKKSGRRGFM